MEGTGVTPDPERPLGILFALRQESGPFLRLLGEGVQRDTLTLPKGPERLWRTTLKGRRIVVLHSGPGLERSREAAEALVEQVGVRSLLCAGFAAGLDPALRPATVVVATAVVGCRGARLEPEQHGDLVADWAAVYGLEAMRPGVVASLDRVLIEAREKAEAKALWCADAADMESLGAAQAAEGRGVAWAVARAVTDAAEQDMPLDFNRHLGAKGLSLGGIVVDGLMHPRRLPGLASLGARSSRAARALAAYVHAWVTCE